MNAAIIGIGKLGSVHLRIYRELAQIKKIYAVDTDQARFVQQEGVECLSDYRKLAGKVDLVSVATPTAGHFKVAAFFLEHKIPVLVEKPLTQNIREAEKLIALSKKNKAQLCVGHVERYNNAYLAIKKIINSPLFIECHRLSPYPNRSLDISVALDLMIHDLDIIQYLVKDKIKKIEARGVKVLSKTCDIANARITFSKGCVANITASRISEKRERKLRVFTHNAYISMDYAGQQAEIYKKTGGKITKELIPINKEEPLKNEIIHFVELVKNKIFTLEYAEKAKDALALALKIEKIINRN